MSARKRTTKSATADRGRPPAQSTAPSPVEPRTFARQSLWLLFLSLTAATLVAYSPAWHGGLLWDDDGHITPVALRSMEGLWRIWFDVGATQQYYPAVHTAFWIQHLLWGDDTLGYHLVNIVLHAGSACLVAVILRRLAVPGAMLAAVIFALHPIQVESVAWITELKNTLSGVCYLGAALAYLRFDERRDRRMYFAALALFLVALFSKSVTSTLPAGLLIVFWWQRGRIDWRRDVLPLVPFFVTGLAAGLLTVWVEHTFIGAHGVDFELTPIARVLIAGRAIWFYLYSFVWPADLMFTYPRWEIDPGEWRQYLFPLGVGAALVALALMRWRTRAPLAALLFFCVTLSPALGFVNVYPFRYSFVADHFAYLANISIIALVAAGIVTVVGRWARLTATANAAIVLAVGLPLAALTSAQSRQYTDAETLYRTTLERNPSCWFAHNNLASILLTRGPAEVRQGIEHAREALRLDPHNPEAEFNVALGLETVGDLGAAAAQYTSLVADLQRGTTPDGRLPLVYRSLGRIHNNMGLGLVQQGRAREAADQLREALRYDPSLVDVHFNLGLTLEALGDFSGAATELRAAVAARPEDTQARDALARVLRKGT